MSTNEMARTRIDIGEGDFVDVTVASDGRWLLDFVSSPMRTALRPTTESVKVEAIMEDGSVIPLIVSDSDEGGWLEASGRTAGASHIRIVVPHDEHMHVRSVPIAPGREQSPKRGPAGGAMLDLGHGSQIEVVAHGSGQLDLRFWRDARPDDHAPSAETVKVESIAQGGMVRPLLVTSGDSRSSLTATGPLAGVERVRVIIQHAGHAHTHELTLAGAN